MHISIPCAVFFVILLVLAGMFLMAIILSGKEETTPEEKGYIHPDLAEEYLLMYNVPEWQKAERGELSEETK